MAIWNHRLVALGATIFLGLSAGAATGQGPVQPAASTGDGLVRSEVSLAGYTTSIAYSPALHASDPTHRGVLSSNGASAPARVRVAQLETNAALRVGELAVGRRDPAGVRYDVWLEATATGWQLQVTDTGSAVVGHVPLTRQSGATAPQLVAGLVPETGTTARLVLQWGDYEATTDVTFADPPRQRRAEASRPNVTTNRTHDEDTSALARTRLLAQRNETALVLGHGHRFSVSFQRTFGRGERPGDGGIRTRGLPGDGPDFARLMSTPDGSIVMLTEAAVPRLRVDAPLRFGSAVIKTGNQVPGFPGSYGIWLKRVGSGWRLVFNDEPDVWGSQHDPKFDAADVELSHSTGHAPGRPFAVALRPTAADRGRLLIVWGPHEWSAEFVVAN